MELTEINANEVERPHYCVPLIVGAFWNIFFGGLGVFNLPLHVDLFYHTVTSGAEFIANTQFWLAVLVAGIGYGFVGFVNHKYRFFVSLGAAGKIAFFLFVFHLWFGGVATNFAAVIAFGDLLWGVYFITFIYRTREHGYL